MHIINIEIRKKRKWKLASHIIRTKAGRLTKKIMEWTPLEDKSKGEIHKKLVRRHCKNCRNR